MMNTSLYPTVYPSLNREDKKALESRHVLIIDRHVAEQVLTPEDCMNALEDAFLEEATASAVNRPKSNIHMGRRDANTSYRYRSMEGGIQSEEVVAVRISSDVSTPKTVLGMVREEWYSTFPGRFLGIVLLFSSSDGSLLAICHDAHIQHMRVAATHAIATKFLARQDASVLGVLGSGGLAWTHVLFMSRVRPVVHVKVFSPNAEHRKRFAELVSTRLGVFAEASDSPEKAVQGCDIVSSCTNAHEPVLLGKWLQEGMHISVVKLEELDEEACRRLDRWVSYRSRPGAQSGPTDNYYTYKPDPELRRLTKGGNDIDLDSWFRRSVGEQKISHLNDVLTRIVPGRQNAKEITGVLSEGTGVQFAALSSLVYREAVQRGLGRRVPLKWFLQDVTN